MKMGIMNANNFMLNARMIAYAFSSSRAVVPAMFLLR
jgi:hypothetical protein